MRILLFSVVAVAAFLGLMAAVPLPADDTPPAGVTQTGEQEPTKPRVAITISEETTRIVSPLRPDGYPDYIAALNEHYSRGVTPENNAAVLLRQAMGPGEIPEELRDRYFELLGMAPLPEQGDYFVPFYEYVADRDDLKRKRLAERQFDQALEAPWSKEQYPVVADWLAANEKPLGLIVEATTRPRYYSPLVAEEDSLLVFVFSPAIFEVRSAGRALAARAMLCMHEGKTGEAWHDLLAYHRLARLTAQGPTLVDGLVGVALEGHARRADAVMAHFGTLTAEQARACQADLCTLPEMTTCVDKIDMAERWMFLDTVSYSAREGPHVLQELDGTGGSDKPTVRKTLLKWLTNMAVDWDVALRMGNSWYDRLVRGAHAPVGRVRSEMLDEIEEEMRAMRAKVKDPESIAKDLLSGKSPRAVASERMGQAFLGLFLPGIRSVLDVEDRNATQARLTDVVFTLAAYRADHGSYPAELAELGPQYLVEMPKDPFTGEDFRYRRRGTGYLLYSVGPNGKDDDGRNRRFDNVPAKRQDDYEGDDIAIHMPPKKR